MNAEKCKECKYRKVFYIGTEKEPKFTTPSCRWAWRYCEDVKPIECHFAPKA